jgi:uncharacterized protein
VGPTIHPHAPQQPPFDGTGNASRQSAPEAPSTRLATVHDISWVLLGPRGLRAGWSALLFVTLYYLLTPIVDTIAVGIDPSLADQVFSPYRVLVAEFIPFLILAILLVFMARIEHRRVAEYNVADLRRARHFLSGAVIGFGALSGLVAALALGGWMHLGRTSLSGVQAVKFASLWACAFLLVGLFEEGTFRCYLQFTLTRGINFWWALAAVAALCLLVQFSSDPKGREGVYIVAALGVVPCWILHRAYPASDGFWHAAWTTSTAFGYYHTNNNGENWIGVLAAALIGIVFCVSVRLTGSAWWAIGCHSAWDWAETYFYGTPDSGFPAQRHLFSSSVTGNTLWSGGADGPEGSLLVVPIILLVLVFLLLVYWPRGGSLAVIVGSDAPFATLPPDSQQRVPD